MTTEPTNTQPSTTQPSRVEPVHQDAGPVSLGEALRPWGVRGAGDLADALARAVGVVGNAPGVRRVSVRCPDRGSDLPHVAVVVTDPDYVRRLAERLASRVTEGMADLGRTQTWCGLSELDDGPCWSAVLDGVHLFVFTECPEDEPPGQVAS